MIKSSLFLLPLLGALLTTTFDVRAQPPGQYLSITGSGCSLGVVSSIGSPLLGRTLTINVTSNQCQPLAPGASNALLFGTPLTPAPGFDIASVGVPACLAPCFLSVNPFDTITTFPLVLTIPNNPTLVGVTIAMQNSCIQFRVTGDCISLSQALNFTIG